MYSNSHVTTGFLNTLKSENIVDSSTTNKDSKSYISENFLFFEKCINNSGKCFIYMSKICYSTCNNKIFFSRRIGCNECIKKYTRIFTGIFSIGIPTTFPVVSYLAPKTKTSKCICNNHTCSPTAREEPYPSIWIQNTKLETCSCFCIKFFYILFSMCFFFSKWMWKWHINPMFFLFKKFTIIETSYSIETNNISHIIYRKRIYLK